MDGAIHVEFWQILIALLTYSGILVGVVLWATRFVTVTEFRSTCNEFEARLQNVIGNLRQDMQRGISERHIEQQRQFQEMDRAVAELDNRTRDLEIDLARRNGNNRNGNIRNGIR